jgi:hypothetical protein
MRAKEATIIKAREPALADGEAMYNAGGSI